MLPTFPVDSAELYAAMLEAAPDALLLVDADGRILLVNRQTEKLLGYPRQELLGTNVDGLVPDAHRARHRASRAEYFRSPRVRTMGTVGNLTARRKDGAIIPVSIALSAIETRQGRFVICNVRDETASRRLQDELRRKSTTDELTEVYNRAFFEAELTRLEAGRRFPVSVIVVDVDGLKPINDAHGHAAGDALLRRAGAVLRTCFRGDDVVARIGGDEFAVLLPEVGSGPLVDTMTRLAEDLARHNEVSHGSPLELSYGGATAGAGPELRAALQRADVRMYEHKRRHGRPLRPPSRDGFPSAGQEG